MIANEERTRKQRVKKEELRIFFFEWVRILEFMKLSINCSSVRVMGV